MSYQEIPGSFFRLTIEIRTKVNPTVRTIHNTQKNIMHTGRRFVKYGRKLTVICPILLITLSLGTAYGYAPYYSGGNAQITWEVTSDGFNGQSPAPLLPVVLNEDLILGVNSYHFGASATGSFNGIKTTADLTAIGPSDSRSIISMLVNSSAGVILENPGESATPGAALFIDVNGYVAPGDLVGFSFSGNMLLGIGDLPIPAFGLEIVQPGAFHERFFSDFYWYPTISYYDRRVRVDWRVLLSGFVYIEHSGSSAESSWISAGDPDVIVTTDAAAVPEPSTFALAGLGLVGLGWVALRKKYRRA